MRIASWNVNSIKVRWPHVLDWLQAQQPDVLCLQELKCENAAFPWEAVEKAGYQACVAGQKAYNGVALLSKTPGLDPVVGLAGFDDSQQRVIAATFGTVRVWSVYCPNGESLTSEKYAYKLRWFEALRQNLQMIRQDSERVVVAGDFNIAPEDRDVYDPQSWQGEVLCSAPERAAFGRLLELGFKDSFRLFEQAAQRYSWWHYRAQAFRRNRGLRIDHLLVSSTLAPACRASDIDVRPRSLERPSDHAPVWLDLAELDSAQTDSVEGPVSSPNS